ncbi:MAG: squalene--hopene cyclase [Thermodesulforhabdaceae bacterium]
MAEVACRDVKPDKLERSIQEAVEWLKDAQKPEGYWMGWLESNSCMEAEWLLAFYLLGIDDPVKKEGLIKTILDAQRPDGSWEVYYNAPAGDINATVECYAALRSAGFSADHPALRRARDWILSHGGVNSVRVFTQYWLALIGEWPWEKTPTIPPEFIFAPHWFPINIYEFASWARATLVPLMILCARRPVKHLPPGLRLDELFPDGRDVIKPSLKKPDRLFSWDSFFYWIDRTFSRYNAFPIKIGRETAIKLCLEWIIRHQEVDGAWGGIQPPWVYGLIALNIEGFPLDHPIMAKGLKALDEPHWSYWKDGGWHIQASNSPVWDTVLAMVALLDVGIDYPSVAPMLKSATQWVLENQVLEKGDWYYKAKSEPGGWAFEMANRWYPDVDDTAVALIALARMLPSLSSSHAQRVRTALVKAEQWVRALQSSNGGWAAFDKDNTNWLITRIPFCDFGEVLDPPSVDVTAHVVEAFATLGRTAQDTAIKKALSYIKSEQEKDGSWFGRWGVNHIYGTSAVLQALSVLGEDMNSLYIRRAAHWIVEHQNEDGGWGETPASYMDPTLRGVGPSTPSQTAWAILGLIATKDRRYEEAVRRGIGFLVDTQRDGTWDEPYYTATGFPGYGHGARTTLDENGKTLEQGVELSRGFMINYNMYRHYFPLMALARARNYLSA